MWSSNVTAFLTADRTVRTNANDKIASFVTNSYDYTVFFVNRKAEPLIPSIEDVFSVKVVIAGISQQPFVRLVRNKVEIFQTFHLVIERIVLVDGKR